MACYAAIVSLAQAMDQILQHDHDQSSYLPGKLQIKSLHDRVLSLQIFLENYPQEAGSLEARMRDVAIEAKDVIQSFILEKNRHILTNPELRLRCDFQELFQELQKVTQEIYSLAVEVKEIKDALQIKDKQLLDFPTATPSSRLAPTTSTDKDLMVGFENDLAAIKERLCAESSKLQVIPIYGMGGIGKTTLAINAYDDLLCIERFDIRGWTTVSQTYTEEGILSNLLLSMGVSSKTSSTEDVHKTLKGRRYLVVVDDMWSTTAWDAVRWAFPDDSNGSRIILTTRLLDVATYADSSSAPHEMQFMNEDQSWNLLKEKVFQKKPCPPKLENKGRMIAKNCSGLPLAIAVVGGFLSTVSQTKTSWQNIAESVKSAVGELDDHLALKIISLSYTHLPHHLRPCFLFLASFQEGHEIPVSKLVRLWVAEGFIKPSGSKSLEEAAGEDLEELVKRSLVLISKKKPNGKIKSCRLHDVVRDMCIRRAAEEKFLVHATRRQPHDILPNQLRVSISFDYKDRNRKVCGSSTHTVMCFLRRLGLLSSIKSFRLLRVLDVEQVYSFPVDQVLGLCYLRYLGVNRLAKVPSSISSLQNLQTLVIGKEFVKLPLEIWRMRGLRHLICQDRCWLPNAEGATASPLENLQTLSAVQNFVCTKRNLEMIPNLKKLRIFYSATDRVQNYCINNLALLDQLQELTFAVGLLHVFSSRFNPVFPKTLKKLTLRGWWRPWKDITIVGSLPNLEVLKLQYDAFRGAIWETTEGEFAKLKFLLIGECDIQEWITESSHFPSLESLHLRGCHRLKEIPEAIGEIATLKLIKVDNWNEFLAESAKRMQEDLLENFGNDDLQVHIVPRYL